MYQQYLSTLRSGGKHRKLPEARQGHRKDYLDFSTNDYLRLSQHPDVIEASIAACKEYGVGSTGSRLLSGNTQLHEQLETQIAKDKNTESSLIFNSGFQANISALSALLDEQVLGEKPLVFFDKLNHASLYQAVFLSGARLVRYNHNDMAQLTFLLAQHKDKTCAKFIVTETVFGMDGDQLPLQQIAAIAKQHNAFLYLDEAHATGLFGINGYGLSTTVDLSQIPHLVMGTFSKALGCSGGYVACTFELKDYLINKAAGFIYTTAPPAANVGAALKAWDIVRTLDKTREKLFSLSALLKEELLKAGFDIGKTNTHIVPIVLQKEEIVMKAKDILLENKIIVSAIRPPTVPPNTARLRVALNAHHTEKDVEKLLQLLRKIR